MAENETCPYCGSDNTNRLTYLACFCLDCREEFESYSEEALADYIDDPDPEVREELCRDVAEDYEYRFNNQELTEAELLALSEEDNERYWDGYDDED